VNKAGEWASTVKESGLMDSIKSGASTVLDKSKEVGSSMVEKIKDTNLGEKSLDALSSVGSYVSTGASAVYSKVRGTEKTSLYRDMEDVQNDAGEKLFNPEPNSQYGSQPKGNYVPPQGEFSWKKDDNLAHTNNGYFSSGNQGYDYQQSSPSRNSYQGPQQSSPNRNNYQNPQQSSPNRNEYQNNQQRSFDYPDGQRNNSYQAQRSYNQPQRTQQNVEVPDFLTGNNSLI